MSFKFVLPQAWYNKCLSYVKDLAEQGGQSRMKVRAASINLQNTREENITQTLRLIWLEDLI